MGGNKILEEKISMLEKVRAKVKNNLGIYLVSGAIGLSALASCGGEERESCYKENGCVGYHYQGAGCGSGEYCICTKPEGTPNSECSCRCVTPHDPNDHGY